jgi:integrase
VARRKGTPGAANDVLKKLRILLRFAIDNGMRKDDPTLRIKSFAEGTFHTWTDEEISAFERHWPIGTRERTAFALFLYTGQRLGDVRRMSWRDVEGSTIRVIQGKTKAELWIPLHPDLSAALAAWPRTHMVMLTTHYGEPHSVKGLGNWMAATIAQAGLPDRCVTHGLRKAAARRLAEAGCTAHQIMSITGHQSIKEVERYTKAVEQKRLAVAAIEQQVRAENKLFQP